MIYLKYLSVLSFIFAMLLELAGFIWLNRLYTACQNMQGVRHTLLKQILLRFTNCARLNIRICNTYSFVKKYLSNYTFAGLHYNSLQKLSTALSMIGLVLTTYGTLTYSEAYYKYAFISILFFIIYTLFCRFIDTSGKIEQTIDMITDYLDNTLNHRLLPAENFSVQNAAVSAAATDELRATDTPASDTKNNPTEKNSSKTKEELNSDEIIFSVINDFLV